MRRPVEFLPHLLQSPTRHRPVAFPQRFTVCGAKTDAGARQSSVPIQQSTVDSAFGVTNSIERSGIDNLGIKANVEHVCF
jgi:hypothetical protein